MTSNESIFEELEEEEAPEDNEEEFDSDFDASDIEEVKELILEWLETKNATLIGRFFDVSKQDGKEEFADWLTGIFHELYLHNTNYWENDE